MGNSEGVMVVMRWPESRGCLHLLPLAGLSPLPQSLPYGPHILMKEMDLDHESPLALTFYLNW